MNAVDKYEKNDKFNKLYKFSDFLCKFLDAIDPEKNTLVSLISNPFISAVIGAAKDSVPVIKFAASFLSKITSVTDINEQCMILCNIAYQHAFAKTIKENPDIVFNVSCQDLEHIKNEIKSKNISYPNIELFDISCVLSSDFILETDTILHGLLNRIGIKYQDIIKFINCMHLNFQISITELFADPDLSEKFAKLKNYIQMRSDIMTSKIVLKEYAHYNAWLFSECPLYKEKDFALKNIYVKPNFHMQGPQYHNRRIVGVKKIDLEKCVMDYLKDDKFNSFIAINGSAGTGKSSFTLNLCHELVKMGMIPIRIPFKKIKFNTEKKYFESEEIYSILEKSISFQDTYRYGECYPQVPNKLFCEGEIFKERISFGKALISPYILILDGWDELNNDIQQKITVFLKHLYETFIRNNNNKIRVILTGRTNIQINKFWADIDKDIPILSINSLNSNQLTELIKKLDYYHKLPEHYRNTLIQKFQDREGYDILKSPLIVFIIHELLTDSSKKIDIENMFNNKALLYKTLADITCENAGKRKTESNTKFDTKLYGEKLRDVLKKTAAVISIKGEELVSHDDLKSFLSSEELGITEDEILKALVSYYFKGHHYNAGCEFIHKSFREYFFAEYLFDLLQEKDEKIFENSMVKLLSTKQLKDEEIIFIEGMLENKIKNPYTKANSDFIITIRKNLIKLWSNWTDEKYLKCSADKDEPNIPLIKFLSSSLKLSKSKQYNIEYLNTTLGINILMLNIKLNKVVLHSYNIDTLRNINILQTENFLVKFKADNDNKILFLFAPLNKKNVNIRGVAKIFQQILDGYFEDVEFEYCYFGVVNIVSVNFPNVYFHDCIFETVLFSNCSLNLSFFVRSVMRDCEFYNCEMSESTVRACEMENVTFSQTNLSDSEFNDLKAQILKIYNTDAISFKMNECEISEMDLAYSICQNAQFHNCKIENSKIIYSNMSGLKVISKSILNEVNFEYVNLNKAEIHDSQLTNIKFRFVQLLKMSFISIAASKISFLNSLIKECKFVGDLYRYIVFEQSQIKQCYANEDILKQLNPDKSQTKNFIIHN